MLTVLGVAMAIIVTFFTLYKLVEQVVQAEDRFEFSEVDARLSDLDALAEARALIVHELKELELDRDTGKLDDADYARLERRYKREWLKIDKQITELGVDVERMRDDVDAELHARLEAEAEAERTRRPRKDRAICPSCAAANTPDAGFCSTCGASMSRAPGRLAQEGI